MLAMRLDSMLHASIRTTVQSFDEWVPDYKANRAGPLYDTGGEQVGTQLIGKGKQLRGADKSISMLQVSGFLQATGNSQWVSVGIEPIELCSFILHTSMVMSCCSLETQTQQNKVQFCL